MPLDVGDAQVGARLAEVLGNEKLGKCDALVAVGRSTIELKLMTLPPAPDEELPDLARFQAVREFNTLGADWPLDFIMMDRDPAAPRTVLAAAMSPAQVAQVQAICQAAQLDVQRIVLRPCGAAALMRQRPMAGDARVRLLVDPLPEEADLTVLVDQTVVFTRTVRLPATFSVEERTQTLLNEVRRTLPAVHSQLGDQRVQRIYISGDDPECIAVSELIDAQLNLPVERFDPFASVAPLGTLQCTRPVNSARFAPLLGMLCDAASETKSALDFLNPTLKPQPPDRRRFYLLCAAAVAAAVLIGVGLIWSMLKSRDREIASLQEQVRENTALLTDGAAREKHVGQVDGWALGDVNFLEELRDVSEKMPPAESVMLSKLNFDVTTQGPALAFDGVLANYGVLDVIHRQLRSDQRVVAGRGAKQDDTNARYPWVFDGKLTYPEQSPKTGKSKAPRRIMPTGK